MSTLPKLKVLGGLAMLAFCGHALAVPQDGMAGVFHSGSADTGSNRGAVRANGDIEAVHSEKGMTNKLSIRLVGRVAIIALDNGISTGTTTVNLGAMGDWMKSHPDLAYQLDSAARMVNKSRSGSLSVNAQPMGTGRCRAELKNLLEKADAAVTACAWGGGIMCALATVEYGTAKDDHDKCINAADTEAGG